VIGGGEEGHFKVDGPTRLDENRSVATTTAG